MYMSLDVKGFELANLSSDNNSRMRKRLTAVLELTGYKHRGQTFAHARVVVGAELSASTITEEKYISGRLHKGYQLLLAVLLLCLVFVSCCLVMSVCFFEIL